MKSIYEKINNHLFFNGVCLDNTVYMPRAFGICSSVQCPDIRRRQNKLREITRSYKELINRQTYSKEQ